MFFMINTKKIKVVFIVALIVSFLSLPVAHADTTPDQAQVFKNMFNSLMSIHTFRVSSTGTLLNQDPTTRKVLSSSNSTLNVNVNLLNLFNPGFDLTLIGDYAVGTKLQNFSIQTRLVNKIAYIKIMNLPDLGFNISSFKNKWIKIDLNAAATAYGLNGNPSVQAARLATIQSIITILANNNILDVQQVLPEEKIDGVMTYHYVVNINKEHFKEALFEIVKVLEPTITMTAAQEAQARATINSDIDNRLQVRNFSIWIGKNDFYVRRLAQSTSYIQGTQLLTTISTSNFTNINKPISIPVPPVTIPIEKVMQSLYTTYSVSTTKKPATLVH